MNTYERMVDEIVALNMALMSANMGGGTCPHAMYPLNKVKKHNICGEISCRECHLKWREQKVKEVYEETLEQFDKKKDQKWARENI